jgi:hypothetical protein
MGRGRAFKGRFLSVPRLDSCNSCAHSLVLLIKLLKEVIIVDCASSSSSLGVAGTSVRDGDLMELMLKATAGLFQATEPSS